MKSAALRRAASTLFAMTTIALMASTASAISLTIDGSSCGSCEGSDLFLDIVDNGGSFDVTLTINTDAYTGPKDGLYQVGFGGIRGWSSVVLASAPSSSVIGWADPVAANVSSSGACNNGANTGKICSFGYVDVAAGGDYTWQFSVIGGVAATDAVDLHIGGQYADLVDLSSRRGPRGHLISESGTPVPEPHAALLFGAGMLVIARSRRR